MAAPGGNQYGDKSDAPLSDEERVQVQRFTTDPLAFDEKFTFWLKKSVERIVKVGGGIFTRHITFETGKGINPPPDLGPDGSGGLFIWYPGFVYGAAAQGQWAGRWDGSTTGQTQLESLCQPLVYNYNYTGTHFGVSGFQTIVAGPLPFPAAGTWDMVGFVAARDDVNSRNGTLQAYFNGTPIFPYGGLHFTKGESNGIHFGGILGTSYPAPYGDFETDQWDIKFISDDPAQGSEIRMSLMLFPSSMYPNPVADSGPVYDVSPTLVPATDPDSSTDSVGCNPGIWSGSLPITYSYAWEYSAGGINPFTPMPVDPGDVNTLTAPLTAFGLAPTDVIQCIVTATNGAGSTNAGTPTVTVL